MKRCPKRKDRKKKKKEKIESLRNKTPEGKIPDTCLYYSG